MTAPTPSSTTARAFQAMTHIYHLPDPVTHSNALSWRPPPLCGGHRGRYLWTDAFATLNLISLAQSTANPSYLLLAMGLILTVHDVLGRKRESVEVSTFGTSGAAAGEVGDARYPRLEGATDLDPLGGGLRIVQLAKVAWVAFAVGETGEHIDQGSGMFAPGRQNTLRLVWKKSCDLKTVVVGGEGVVDPWIGYGVYRLLQRQQQIE
ncbi:hypothetical protein K402DRAFT_408270 [Aulographum hederae CBS 113979]|uniref:Uncharacterized protein n=1 Tax=Aulographum hederae CBS 113979 TaxID=1176131 RepID=A0A6G1GKW9_9PEZI|nr:hypothetical protein K402DRAFT_408270 [Aulographum hederae CBS 113979]